MNVSRHEAIAVIGAGVRLPGGIEDLDAFWGALRDGRDVVSATHITPDGRRHRAPAPRGDERWAGQLDTIDQFDAEFFGVSRDEASRMDPQQRLALEVAWEAIEDAGVPLEALQPSTGVFLGLYAIDYLALQLADPATINAQTGPGGAIGVAASRVSYCLDLHGLSLAVDTACSSSLVAVAMACRALQRGDCDYALVGGANVLLSPVASRVAEYVLPLSPSGRCRSFDAAADGIVRAEGCAMLLLQRAAAAEAGANRIRGIIRGTAVNQDGRSNGLTAPNPRAQCALHRRALADAACDPADVTYIEAHGTGTPLGDPIELDALNEVYGSGQEPCVIGSVKANLGHLEAASGIVGLIKTMLVLERGCVPPQPHFERLNPEIDLAGSRLTVSGGLTPLLPSARPRLAAVSSFGLGGTNAHAILEEVPRASRAAAVDSGAGPLLLAISARSDGALRELMQRYADRLAGRSPAEAAVVCAAAALQRTHHRLRAGVTGGSPRELVANLRAAAPTGRTVVSPRVAFVFSGQGSQWTGMGRELLECEPVFRREVEACDAVVRDLAGWSVAEQLAAPQSSSRLSTTQAAQVAIGTLQLGLAALWRSWGVMPEAVTGHSMGEIVAACVAGALHREQALELLLERARIAERAARGGAMVSVALEVAEVERLVEAADGCVGIAADNGPFSTVVSGERRAVERVRAAAAAKGAATQAVLVEYGFHSPLLDGCDDQLAATARELQPARSAIPLYSTVTGGRVDAAQLDGAHWGRNLRERVVLRSTIEALADDGLSVFVEVGPHPVLLRDVVATLERKGVRHTGIGSLRRDRPARTVLGESLAELYRAGVDIRWSAIFGPSRARVPLPSYPWQRRRYWLDDDSAADAPVERLRPEPIADLTLYVRERVSRAAGMPLHDVAPDLPLESLGLSSLSVVELRNQVQRELGVVVPLAALLKGGTPNDLAGVIRDAVAA